MPLLPRPLSQDLPRKRLPAGVSCYLHELSQDKRTLSKYCQAPHLITALETPVNMQSTAGAASNKRTKGWKIKSNVVELLSLDETSLQASSHKDGCQAPDANMTLVHPEWPHWREIPHDPLAGQYNSGH